jgi:microcin C transport system substrate-binding protein
MKDQKLVNTQTGKPFVFEMLLPSGGNNQWVLPFQHNLARLGITMEVRQVDNSQITNRLRTRDYDMMPRVAGNAVAQFRSANLLEFAIHRFNL